MAFVIATAIGASAQTPKQCSKSITSCGCTITSPGVYTVDADLNSTQGLTPLQGCIDISAKMVTLLTNGHPINGPAADGMGTPPSGVGIHVLPSASMAFLEARGPNLPGANYYTIILGWQYGLESEASSVIADDFQFNQNSTGVLLQKAINNNINDYTAKNNSVYGVWVKSSVGNQLNCAGSQDNSIAGVYVGCSATGPNGAACSQNEQGSRLNYIYDMGTEGNAIYYYYGNLQGEEYGIALEKGSEQNTIVDNYSVGNTIYDMFDGNPKCDSNIWRLNQFQTANRSCIQ
ncbi:MAG: hypothetical protein JOY93_06935 [Acidobacteriales bacterium]|nr:hypothetical protein [Terriglobales bacterium]